MESMKDSSDSANNAVIRDSRELITKADKLIVGVGAGMSASAGLDYSDPHLVELWYPEYGRRGLSSIGEIQGFLWNAMGSDPTLYWGFWAQHIALVRYEPDALPPYRALFKLINGKDYFICTTNVDRQLGKAGFPNERIFAPQGDYGLFQCDRPCSDEVYQNDGMIRRMNEGISIGVDGLPRIRDTDIPRCPRCGELLKPNLRCDDTFVEAPHMANIDRYRAAVQDAAECPGQVILLELGVGFNTPSIIRYPFERFALGIPNAVLIRINRDSATLPSNLQGKAVCVSSDVGSFLEQILSMYARGA